MAHGAFILPSTRVVKNSNDADGASWNSSMRNGLDGPLAMEMPSVASDFTLGEGGGVTTISSALATVGSNNAATAMSEAVAVSMSRRVVVCGGVGISKSYDSSLRAASSTADSIEAVRGDSNAGWRAKEAHNGTATKRGSNISALSE